MRELIKIKHALQYFQKNKYWIIGLLYISSITKECVWYSMFGINILTFSTIQDTFISFFNHTLIFIIITINYYLIHLIFPDSKKSKILNVLRLLTILFISFIYFQIFKKPVSFITILLIFGIIYLMIDEKKYTQALKFSIIFLITFSTIEPLIQAFIIKNQIGVTKKNTQFEWRESNMDYYSFEYEKNKFDTKLENYFLIGINKEYFFIFDGNKKKTLIIPKEDCKNIIAEFTFFSPNPAHTYKHKNLNKR